MRTLPIRYQASFFASVGDVPIKAEQIAALVQSYARYELLPSTFQEIGLGTSPMLRVRMAQLNNELGVDIGSQRIDVEKNLIDAAGKSMGSAAAFCSTAEDLIKVFLKQYPRKGHRLAYISRIMLQDLDGPLLAKIFDRVFSPLPYFEANKPFEWNSRWVADGVWKNGDEVEALNVIIAISRAQGALGPAANPKSFDSIVVDFDINTKPSCADTRFGVQHVPAFLQAAVGMAGDLEQQVLSLVK